MGSDGIGVADPLNYGHLALVVELLDGTHAGVEAHVVIHGQHLIGGKPQHIAIVLVVGVAVGNEGVQGIVGAGHLKYHQDRVFLGGGHLFLLTVISDGVPAPISVKRVQTCGPDSTGSPG